MNLALVLSVAMTVVLWTHPSFGVDCAALPTDSFARLECERNVQKEKEAKPERGATLEGSAQTKRDPGPAAAFARDPFPPLRYAGQEPLMTIFLMSGATARADKAWVEGDRLFYWSRSVQGSFRLVDVDHVEDHRYLAARQVCDAMQRSYQQKDRELDYKMRVYRSFPSQLAMAMWNEVQGMGHLADKWCEDVRAWYYEYSRAFWEARYRAWEKQEADRQLDPALREMPTKR